MSRSQGLSLQSVLDALPMPVAVLDEDGTIIQANAAWSDSAEPPPRLGIVGGVGANYLQTYEGVAGEVAGTAVLRQGVRRVLGGRRKAFAHTCRIVHGEQACCVNVKIKRLDTLLPARFLVSHEAAAEVADPRQDARETDELVFEMQRTERQRLAAELHDSVGQSLVSLGLNLSHLRMIARQVDGGTAILDEMSAALQEVHAQIRTSSYLLHPPWPEHEGGFETAARQFVQGFGKRAGLRTDIRVHGTLTEIKRAREMTLFRILQEALVNIHRHAHATAVIVELVQQRSEVTLQVTDDGVGFTGPEGDNVIVPGVGLLGMRARVRQFGGELTIESADSGTTLKVRLPLPGA